MDFQFDENPEQKCRVHGCQNDPESILDQDSASVAICNFRVENGLPEHEGETRRKEKDGD